MVVGAGAVGAPVVVVKSRFDVLEVLVGELPASSCCVAMATACSNLDSWALVGCVEVVVVVSLLVNLVGMLSLGTSIAMSCWWVVTSGHALVVVVVTVGM